MRALIQRVSRCSVSVDGTPVSNIGPGMLVLLGVHADDSEIDTRKLAERCAGLRIFDDPEGKMNLSVRDVSGDVMVVSQFTLYGDTKKGNRPSYSGAAPPDRAEYLYTRFVEELRTLIAPNTVSTGTFRALMDVELVNNGPVTLLLESKKE